MEYLLFCLVCYGISVNIVKSLTLARVTDRPSLLFFHEMFDCIKCTGFWVGVLVSGFIACTRYWDISCLASLASLGKWTFADIIWAGFLSSGTCWIISMVGELHVD